ncbi:hypothetical protein [Agromyces arachidis]|uniref:hypothetical protein n=1 Tax=Agromyces arachidis TaxID=766966 RepID=UPI00405794BB
MTTPHAGVEVEHDGGGGAGPGARRVAADVAFWLAVAALVAANLAVLVPGIATVRLWEDEAFNLTVPINLAHGLGYTSDGILSGSVPMPFDVRISTGPVMLLPIAGLIALGIDPVIAGRAVATAGYAVLIAALALIGHRLGGRWAALVAVALPLAFDAAAMPSPIQTPADILGEVTAAALLAAALAFLHRRPWLAGLLLGLAIQVKFIALLAAPAFALAVLLDAPLPWRARLRRSVPRVLIAATAAALPTIVFEFAKFASLGPSGYAHHVLEFVGFLRSGGQRGYAVSPLEKLTVLAESWNLPVVVAAVVGVVALVAGAALVVVAIRRMPPGAPRDEFTAVVLAAALGLATYLAWWFVSRHTPAWVRHPAPAVLAFAPVLAASLVPAARILLSRTDRRGHWAARVATIVAVIVLAFSIVGRAVNVGTESRPTGETLASQRAAAGDIAGLGYDRFAVLWGPGVSVGVLAGAEVGLTDAVEVTAGDPRIWFGEPPPRCDVQLRSGLYSVCIPE